MVVNATVNYDLKLFSLRYYFLIRFSKANFRHLGKMLEKFFKTFENSRNPIIFYNFLLI